MLFLCIKTLGFPFIHLLQKNKLYKAIVLPPDSLDVSNCGFRQKS